MLFLRTICLALVAGSLFAVIGCAPFLGKRALDYRTIAASPYHDTDAARRKHEHAVNLIERGNLIQAEKLLQEALICDVTFAPAHNNLGQLYFQQGKLYLAAWEFEYAKELMEERPEPYNNLGLVYESVGRLEQAIDMFSSAYAMEPENPEYIGNLARACLRRGDKDQETIHLLDELRIYDTRPDWIAWANYELAVGPVSSQTKLDEASSPMSSSESMSETLELLPPADTNSPKVKSPTPAVRPPALETLPAPQSGARRSSAILTPQQNLGPGMQYVE